MKKVDLLQFSFVHGKTPSNLGGFYKGKLELLLPHYPIEYIGSFIAKFWLPWRGKEFFDNRGVNVLPFGMHKFPFTTKATKGIEDTIKVLQLNYDISENPTKVRSVVDELVEIEPNKYLGKAFIKNGELFRLVAFFTLEK